ncbi:MAG: hypothetical protein J5789_05565 [Oscillospiraceae bacterium]|nr:hypothetical protein [Oscillospiraceae bacterium]
MKSHEVCPHRPAGSEPAGAALIRKNVRFFSSPRRLGHYIPIQPEMQPYFPGLPVEYHVEIRWISGGRTVDRLWKTWFFRILFVKKHIFKGKNRPFLPLFFKQAAGAGESPGGVQIPSAGA